MNFERQSLQYNNNKCCLTRVTYSAKNADINKGPGGVHQEKLGGGVRPSSQNPYPVYDQNLRYSLPFLWSDQNFETLFMTRPLHQNPAQEKMSLLSYVIISSLVQTNVKLP